MSYVIILSEPHFHACTKKQQVQKLLAGVSVDKLMQSCAQQHTWRRCCLSKRQLLTQPSESTSTCKHFCMGVVQDTAMLIPEMPWQAFGACCQRHQDRVPGRTTEHNCR